MTIHSGVKNYSRLFLFFLLSGCFCLTACDMSGFSSDPRRRLVKQKCSACHSTKRIYKSHRTRVEWGEIIDRMVRHGAQLEDEEKGEILGYLTRDYGR